MKRFKGVRWTLVMTLLASLMALVPSGTAVAAESVPELRWPAVTADRYGTGMVTSPTGSVTMPCSYTNGTYSNLKTYSAAGQLTREILATQTVDGVPNCINYPAVDKNDDIYGVPASYASGSRMTGPLVAYDGNTKKWQYPTGCTSTYSAPVVGAGGNIYFTNGDGRLIGLTPEVESGTTQPKKVLDVQAQAGCGTKLYAFKDSVAVQWYSGQRITYYSYTGANLGSPSGDYDNDGAGFTFNADGRLFYPNFVGSGSTASFTLSAYDPWRKSVTWTAQSSLFGQYGAGHARTMPTPDGGAYVIVQRKKVVGGTTTSETIYAIVKLNSQGIKTWDKELPNQDSNGNAFTSITPSVDTTGKLVAIRHGRMLPSNGPLQYAISIGIFNPDGTVAYDKVMHGNLVHSEGGVFGYNADQITVGTNTLHLMAQRCTNTLCSAEMLYPIKVTGLGLDYPRGAVVQMSKRLPYVALGDSFSSGQGALNYQTGTATSTNTCYRSDAAYARVLGRDSTSPLRLDGFVACGGSTAPRITSKWPSGGKNLTEAPQSATLSSKTRIVTLTMGGNDIGFADVIKGCVLDCAKSTQAGMTKVNTTLGPALTTAYKAILAKAPNAQVLVLGYPPMLSTASPLCLKSAPFDTAAKRKSGIILLNALNDKIRTTVAGLRNPRIHYLNPAATGSPFIGHDICGKSPYIHGVIAKDRDGSFHPMASGQNAFAKMVASWLKAHPQR